VLGRYFIGAAAIRFVIEFVRVHEPLALGLAPAHWASLLVAGLGLVFLVNRRRMTR
jgi:prolipoprotein diacylglyceryltransferase